MEISIQEGSSRLLDAYERNGSLGIQTQGTKLEEQIVKTFRNYVYAMRENADRVAELSIRLGNEKHSSTSQLKRDIRVKSIKSAELQEKVGSTAFKTALVGFAALLLQFSPERPQVQNVFKWVGEQGSQFWNNMQSNYLMAQKGPLDAIVTLRQAEYTNASGKDVMANLQANIDKMLDTAASMFTKVAAAG